MKIAVVGCGAVGSYYGGRLARAGQEVHFLLRTDYETVRRQGLRVRSPQGDFQVRPRCARQPQEIGPSALVLIGLKTTANDQFRRLLPPLVGPATALLTLQNGLGNEEQLARLFAGEQVLGGLCFVCLNRLAPGLVHHIDHGQIILGEFQGRPGRRTHDLAALFRDAGVPCSVTDNLARAHWEKLAWNIPFNGLGVASAAGYDAVVGGQLAAGCALGPCLPSDRLLAEPKWEKLLRELMLEVIGTARALGFDVPEALADKLIERTRTMGAYKASTLIDFERGLPLELEGLFLAPLRRAQQAKVPVPRLAVLCRLLGQMDRRRGVQARL
ncbi:MAG: 2-dehydropantoate 2-reductase [Verrucomicrobiota bacterium]|jgi:2-dehydropantoate 2-reductase